ncbi:MAG: hypothetical protein ACOC4K_02045 [Verrucomicrobiota bacterium]
MHTKTFLFFLGLSVLHPLAGGAREVLGTVGTHSLRLVEPGKAQQLVSVPYLRVPSARGRLEGVNLAESRLIDQQGAFADLNPEAVHVVLIGSGPQAGHWFLVRSDSRDASSGVVEHDGLAGELDQLRGDETFSVHRLFVLSELFGDAGGLLQAGANSQSASAVSFYRGSSYEQYWLSDGSVAPEGWVLSRNGGHEAAGHSAILPGMSFFLSHPNPVEPVEIRVQGIVVDGPVHLPLIRGYNFVAPVQSRTLFGEKGLNLKIGELGLRESGFLGASTYGGGDKLLIFDNATAGIRDTLYLDSASGEFRSMGFGNSETPQYDMDMGSGAILLNTQGAYTWRLKREP